MSKKRHHDYWVARQEEILRYLDSADLDVTKDLTDIYSEQALQAQKDLYRLYMQYAEDHNMTYQEAQQRLRHVDLSDYRENAARYRKQAEKDPELLKRLNEQYVSSKATRLDALALEMTFRAGMLKYTVEKSFERYLKDSASYAYKKAMGGRAGTINAPALDQLTKTPFNGYNYSQQLWGNVDNLARDLKEALKRGFVRGDGPKEIARELAKRFDVAKHRAVTLVRTDGTMVANKATAQRYMDAGFLYYRDLVRLDGRTTDICREIAKKDERKLLSEMEIGVNAAPYHYNCRTTIIPDEEELGAGNGMDIEIDEFTPCLRDMKTGKLVDTSYQKIEINGSTARSLQKKGWNFDWSIPQRNGYQIYKLTLLGHDEIQGLVALKNIASDSAVKIDIIESAPHNRGKNKKHSGVGGHLLAIAVEKSYNEGNDGMVYFTAKTDLIDYYSKKFGARLIFGRNMALFPEEGAKLLQIYTLKQKGQ